MKKYKNYFILIFPLFLLSCSSVDENVKIKIYHNFKTEQLKQGKTVFLPFILIEKDRKESYLRSFNLAYTKYLKGWSLVLPHQGESLLDTSGAAGLFSELEAKHPLVYHSNWVELGEKIKADYLIITLFNKPKHVNIKDEHRETVYQQQPGTEHEVPRSVPIFTEINMWYQKGELIIIDVKNKRVVYSLEKETKSGYSRRSSRGYGATTIRETLAKESGKEIPTFSNAIVLFFKTIFEEWN
jgi:hypothetical protein